jgi:putative ABC transport system permease protein
MKLTATFFIALRALRRNKLRSALTMLGIIIGVGAVIAMVAVGNGARAEVEATMASLGENMILIFAGNFTTSGARGGWGNAGTLQISDAVSIIREVPGVIGVSPETRSGVQVAQGNQNWATTLLGESPEYFDMRQWPLLSGSVFSEEDVRGVTKVAVLGKTPALMLFGEEDPVGQIIRVKHVPFRVIGVLKPKGLSLNGADQDDLVVVPYTTAMKRLTAATILRGINVQAETADKMDKVEAEIISLLRQRHRILGTREDDFTVRNQQEITERATANSRTMTFLVGAIASVSLLVGGIGIMNIMLVSVTERTREIGIRMAIGAHGRDIMLQFLIEAVALSSLGGVIGILVGIGGCKSLTILMNWPTAISPISVVLSFVFSALVGVFFGLYPAQKAAELDPIDALRYE